VCVCAAANIVRAQVWIEAERTDYSGANAIRRRRAPGLAALMSAAGKPSCVAAVVPALALLSTTIEVFPSASDDILAASPLSSLLFNLTVSSHDARQAAGRLVRNLAATSPRCAKYLVESGALPSLVDCMRQSRDLTVALAVEAAFAVVLGDEALADAAATVDGFVTTLLSLLDLQRSRRITAAALGCLASFTHRAGVYHSIVLTGEEQWGFVV
jgi:hypothetical protein